MKLGLPSLQQVQDGAEGGARCCRRCLMHLAVAATGQQNGLSLRPNPITLLRTQTVFLRGESARDKEGRMEEVFIVGHTGRDTARTDMELDDEREGRVCPPVGAMCSPGRMRKKKAMLLGLGLRFEGGSAFAQPASW
jgi:hypothetical protein